MRPPERHRFLTHFCLAAALVAAASLSSCTDDEAAAPQASAQAPAPAPAAPPAPQQPTAVGEGISDTGVDLSQIMATSFDGLPPQDPPPTESPAPADPGSTDIPIEASAAAADASLPKDSPLRA